MCTCLYCRDCNGKPFSQHLFNCLAKFQLHCVKDSQYIGINGCGWTLCTSVMSKLPCFPSLRCLQLDHFKTCFNARKEVVFLPPLDGSIRSRLPLTSSNSAPSAQPHPFLGISPSIHGAFPGCHVVFPHEQV